MQYNIERVAGASGCLAVVAELSDKLSGFIPEKNILLTEISQSVVVSK